MIQNDILGESRYRRVTDGGAASAAPRLYGPRRKPGKEDALLPKIKSAEK